MTGQSPVAAHQGVSVVLPCYNRGAYLEHWLAAFAWWHSGIVPTEVIVVDDGGADHAPTIVDRWRERGLDVRYLRLRAPGGPRNNAQARNAGIRAARFPLVLNSDPDVLFVTDVVSRLVDAWRPGTFCSVSGYFPLTRPATMDLWHVSEQRPLAASDCLERARGRHNLVRRPDGVYGLHGAFLCDRDTLVRLRGYDERFRCWGWEDRDLLTRLERGLGLERRYVDGAIVVHQWHPALRADEGPGRSRVLWQMGWQRACATTSTSTQRNPDGWGMTDVDAIVEESSPLGTLRSRDEWQQIFDAYLYEAQVWQREGDARTAMKRLRLALARWWETGDTEVTDSRPLETQVALAHEAGYAHAGEVALAYAAAAAAADDRQAADAALSAAASLPDSAGAAASLRARWLSDEGRLEDAARWLEDSLNAHPTAEALARLVEVSLRLNRPDRARAALDAAASSPGLDLDVFDRLLLDGYRARLPGRALERGPWPPALGNEAAGEYLFSVAMRARRIGLHFGAKTAFDAYLSLEEGTEEDLRRRARELRDEASREWTRLLAAAHVGSGPPDTGRETDAS